jgi:hypothetical protein
MDESVLRLIASLCGATGILLLIRPAWLEQIERALNREFGRTEVFALRTNLPVEHRVERWLNTPVGTRSVHWDDALRRHPRATGAGLCALALLLLV